MNKAEYEKIIASQKKQIEDLKMQGSIETLISPYMDGKNITYYTKSKRSIASIYLL